MTDLAEMWREIEKYQPYADRYGFGKTWQRMCEERTKRAAWNASDAARAVAKAAGGKEFVPVEDTPWIASRVARAAATAAVRAAAGLGWPAGNLARRAIKDIREAIEREEKT